MKTDVAIVGAGPGGSAAAIHLQQLGLQTTLIERDSFPRFHIGESMTGECGRQVAKLGLTDAMGTHGFPVKVGTAVYGPSGENKFYVPVMGRQDDGTLTPGSTWQVRRSTFDDLVRATAQERGAELVTGRASHALTDDDGTVTGVRVARHGSDTEVDIHARWVIDASGQGKFLAHTGIASAIEPGRYFKQVAMFTHVKGALRDTDDVPALDTIIYYQKTHHWAWFIPIDDEVTSIGVVVPSAYFRACGESPRDFFLREVQELNPELAQRLPDIDVVEEVRSVSNYSYEVRDYTGPGWMCIGDSHRFIDPIFSFGMLTTMAEADMAATAIAGHLDTPNGVDHVGWFRDLSAKGLERFQTVVDGFWSNPFGFAVLLHQRYYNDFVDMFAGRVYDDADSPGIKALRKLNDRTVARGAPEPVAVATE